MSNISNVTHEDDDIDLNAMLGTLKDHKWLIVIVTGLFLFCSLAYALLATPIYEATAIVQVEQKVPELPGLSALSQTLGASNSEATTEVALITSRTVIGNAVNDLKLDIAAEPQHFPLLGNGMARRFRTAHPGELASAWLGMSGYDWGGSELELQQVDLPDDQQGKTLILVAGENGNYRLLNDHGELLQGAVGKQASGHGVTLLVKTLRANPGTRFNIRRERMLTVVNALQKAIQAGEIGKDSGIIGLSYQNANPAIATALLDRVCEWYVQQNVSWNAAEAAKSLQFVQEQMPKVRAVSDRAQAQLSAFQIKAHSVDITMQTKSLLDQSVAIESNIEQLRMQKADIERRFTPEHPAYAALMQQIDELEAKKAALDKQVGDLPDTQQELLKLTRDVEVNNQTYTGLLNQEQQLDIARAGKVGNVHVVDPAAVDVVHPVKPKRAMVTVGGTFVGAFLAIGIVFLRQMLNRGVEDPAVIEQMGMPVYASIPVSQLERVTIGGEKHVRSDGLQYLLALSAPTDLAIEALRSLRTSLHFARLEAKNNVLMISGSSPGAGKTFISANLAAVIAQAGQRVLLIDGDMRKGTLHKVMGGRHEQGLSELITGQADLATAIREVPSLTNLHYIARGKTPPNPSELLMNVRFTDLLTQLMPLYDLVLVDTPPILAVTDAAIIGHLAGTNLLVVRFGLNQAREIALAKQRFAQNNVEIKGAIFNAVEKRSSGYYSYAYYEYKSAT